MRDSPPHKLDELVAYVYGEATPEERAAFEAHLGDCPDCRADVERLRRLLPYAHAQLRKPLDTSVDGMMRLMEAAERELQATRAASRRTLRGPAVVPGFSRARPSLSLPPRPPCFCWFTPVKKPRDDVAAPRRRPRRKRVTRGPRILVSSVASQRPRDRRPVRRTVAVRIWATIGR